MQKQYNIAANLRNDKKNKKLNLIITKGIYFTYICLK